MNGQATGIVAVSQVLGIEYRLHDGEIQFRYPWMDWVTSHHNDCKPEDAEKYEWMGEPRLAVLVRQKFGVEPVQ